jgi:hypothetical protein
MPQVEIQIDSESFVEALASLSYYNQLEVIKRLDAVNADTEFTQMLFDTVNNLGLGNRKKTLTTNDILDQAEKLVEVLKNLKR